ncbi:zinc-binding dehydrogenase [Lacticaseibacillus parahuelsenbergensis]|uniref:Zinc-binding dehydrogenase n=1 Tax=Lacticaseibacillus parahuelsenbergensis TaxID=3068305 RepID=A0ABY9L2J7_9LACO|nr:MULTISPECIES: zinc-binding dehydrogenase [Lacticaseibacillus]MDE3283894.1 zinc-binding dehydrogenase [Lacticaseibacillus casei]WLV77860.1 zinc-binding dehydrogenase [Lacticaseibacillus sp. NCIMB 15471]
MLNNAVRSKEITSKSYRLLNPGDIEEVMLKHELKPGFVNIQPLMASVCHADDRYFAGKRRPEALAKKLPMALLHEGIGTIKETMSDKFQKGQRVVIVPNVPGYMLRGEKKKDTIPDNYSVDSVFLSSGYDGIAQSDLVQPDRAVVPLPDNIPDEIAILTEVSTVGYHATSHVADALAKPDCRVALFGDGPVGYMAAAVLHYIRGIDKEHLTVFGAVPDRLNEFDFANKELVTEYDFDHAGEQFDVIFEATGGNFSSSAINEGIKVIKRTGKFVLMGVSEDLVPIDTRDILEKGLTFYGTSRSTTPDFEEVVKAMSQSQAYQDTLRKLLPQKETIIRSASDLNKAFEAIVASKAWYKAVLKFEW